MIDLTTVLDALYASEINASISCFWDGGWDVKIGDRMNGFRAEKNFDRADLESVPAWLAEEGARHWPGSAFARQWG